MIAAALLFSKQIAAIDRKAKAKDTKVLNEAKRNEKRVDFDSKGCGLSVGIADGRLFNERSARNYR